MRSAWSPIMASSPSSMAWVCATSQRRARMPTSAAPAGSAHGYAAAHAVRRAAYPSGFSATSGPPSFTVVASDTSIPLRSLPVPRPSTWRRVYHGSERRALPDTEQVLGASRGPAGTGISLAIRCMLVTDALLLLDALLLSASERHLFIEAWRAESAHGAGGRCRAGGRS